MGKQLQVIVLAFLVAMGGVVGVSSSASASEPLVVGGGLNDGKNLHPGDVGFFSVRGFQCAPKITVAFIKQTLFTGGCSTAGIDFTPFQMSVPKSTTPGTYRIHAFTPDGRSAETYLYVAPFNPSATPSSYYAPVGSTLVFFGREFMAGETVRLRVNGLLVGAQGTASQFGGRYFMTSSTVSLEYLVPKSLAGTTATFKLEGLESRAFTTLTVSIAR